MLTLYNMAFGANQELVWLAVPHLGAHPMAEESYENKVMTYCIYVSLECVQWYIALPESSTKRLLVALAHH